MSKIDSRTRSDVGRTDGGSLAASRRPRLRPPMTAHPHHPTAGTPPGSALEEVLALVLAEQQADLVGQVGVRPELRVLVDDRLGDPARLGQQHHVARVAQRGQAQVALPLLAGAQQRALAPEPQVRLGQREAVGRAPPPRPAARCPPRRRAGSTSWRRRRVRPGPRSWCSWAIPKRSALSTTMTVASGTSTPTSITVVATSTCSSPERKRSMTSSLRRRPPSGRA